MSSPERRSQHRLLHFFDWTRLGLLPHHSRPRLFLPLAPRSCPSSLPTIRSFLTSSEMSAAEGLPKEAPEVMAAPPNPGSEAIAVSEKSDTVVKKKKKKNKNHNKTDETSSPVTVVQDRALPRGSTTPGRTLLDVVQFSASLLLRLSVYVFLQWIPTSLAWPLIPALYGTYVLSWLLKDRGVRRLVNQGSAAIIPQAGAGDLKELADGVTVTDQTIGKQVGNAHPAEGEGLTEPPTVQPRGSSLYGKLVALVTGLSIPSRKVNLFNLGLHTLLFSFFLDSYASPYLFPSHFEHNLIFHRVGDIGPTHSKIQVRWPEPMPLFSGMEETSEGSGVLRDGLQRVEKPFRIVYTEVSSKAGMRNRWERGPLLTLLEENDWTTTASLSNLWPATQYEYRLAWAHNNTFVAPHRLLEFQASVGGVGEEEVLSASERNYVGGTFRTWPDPRVGQGMGGLASTPGLLEDEEDENVPLDDPNYFRFITSSCVKPDFPYNPSQFVLWSWLLRLLPSPALYLPADWVTPQISNSWAKRNVIPGFDMIYDRYIKDRPEPSVRFLLSLGDLIYADVPRYGGPKIDTYTRLWRNLFASPSFKRVFEKIPTFGPLDDHEIKNNAAGQLTEGTAVGAAFPPAMQAWSQYFGSVGPDPLSPGKHYSAFRYGNEAAFFNFDTRTQRTPSTGYTGEEEIDLQYVPGSEEEGLPPTVLGQEQKDDFIRWLRAVNNTATFKIVVSSVPFSTLFARSTLDVDARMDSWAAYLSERSELMRELEYVKNVLIISGDRHQFLATSLRSGEDPNVDRYTVTELCVGPLNMFALPISVGESSETDKLLKHIPLGQQKWADVVVDTRRVMEPQLRIKVYVDGEVAWKVKLIGEPVALKAVKTVGGIAKSFLELLNWRPRRWF